MPFIKQVLHEVITIGQTFSDTFSFVELEKSYIPCTSFKDGHIRRLINKCLKPCALTMMQHVMMACDIGDHDFHDFVANNVFFMIDGCVKLMRKLFFTNFVQRLLQVIH